MASSSTDGALRERLRRRLETVESRGEQGEIARQQVMRAAQATTLDAAARDAARIRFVPTCLHAIVRWVPKGSLVIVAAQTGLGKSTFLLSQVDDWIEQGYKVAVLGLEQQDFELRQQMACLRAGVPKEVVAENSWDEHRDGERWFAELQEQLAVQLEEPLIDRLLLLEDRELSVEVMTKAAADAHDMGADILVIDHLNHMEESQDVRQLAKIVKRAKRIAEHYNMVVVAACQINRAAYQGGHRLTRYMPAQIQHLKGGSVIEENAVIVLNLWRPVIVPATEQERKLIEAAKRGEVEAKAVLQPWKMGVMTLKHRISGRLEGNRCVLQLEPNGKLFDPMDT